MALGWLFGKKKVAPKVPLPEGLFDDRNLQFSKKFSGEKVIEPENLQAAAGFNQPFNLPSDLEAPAPPLKSKGKSKNAVPTFAQEKPESAFPISSSGPVYVKVDVYREILQEVDAMKSELNQLKDINTKLETSEYNEEHNFDKLKKAMKSVHDRLLLVDKTLFKVQGE